MRVSTRPGEKSSDQSRVTICCERSANPSGVGAIGERLGDAIRERDERTRAGCERGGARTDLVAEETSEEYGVKLARDDSGVRYCVPSVVSQCGMRRSHTGMRSFHAGRRLVGTTPPPRRPGGEELARQVWICPLRVSVAVQDAVAASLLNDGIFRAGWAHCGEPDMDDLLATDAGGDAEATFSRLR